MSDQNQNPEDISVHSAQDSSESGDIENPGAQAEESGSTPAASSGSTPAADNTPDTEAEDAADDEFEALRKRIAQLEEENSSLKDQYLRKSADFENFRKRMHREKEDSVTFANKQLLLDIVPIIDDFERAIKSAGDSHDFDAFHDGIVLIERQFTSMLERKWGLMRFESVGEEFDPSKHEAVTTEEVPDQEASVVLEDYQKGYLLHEKVLRSAKVKVSVQGSSSGS